MSEQEARAALVQVVYQHTSDVVYQEYQEQIEPKLNELKAWFATWCGAFAEYMGQLCDALGIVPKRISYNKARRMRQRHRY